MSFSRDNPIRVVHQSHQRGQNSMFPNRPRLFSILLGPRLEHSRSESAVQSPAYSAPIPVAPELAGNPFASPCRCTKDQKSTTLGPGSRFLSSWPRPDLDCPLCILLAEGLNAYEQNRSASTPGNGSSSLVLDKDTFLYQEPDGSVRLRSVRKGSGNDEVLDFLPP